MIERTHKKKKQISLWPPSGFRNFGFASNIWYIFGGKPQRANSCSPAREINRSRRFQTTHHNTYPPHHTSAFPKTICFLVPPSCRALTFRGAEMYRHKLGKFEPGTQTRLTVHGISVHRFIQFIHKTIGEVSPTRNTTRGGMFSPALVFNNLSWPLFGDPPKTWGVRRSREFSSTTSRPNARLQSWVRQPLIIRVALAHKVAVRGQPLIAKNTNLKPSGETNVIPLALKASRSRGPS